jgi:sulfur carrier protein
MSTIHITLNGEPRSVPTGLTLQQALALLADRNLDDRTPIATALNGHHVARAERARAMLSEGDQITTFEPITGG